MRIESGHTTMRLTAALLAAVLACACGGPGRKADAGRAGADSGLGRKNPGSLLVLFAGDLQGSLDPCG